MGRSIQEMYDKFKYLLKDDAFFYGTLIILVAVTSFGLGRWSMALKQAENGSKPVKSIEVLMPAAVSTAAQEISTTTKSTAKIQESEVSPAVIIPVQKYVGSKSGTKYHLLTCPGAKQIKEINKVFFATKEDAQKAGYSPASNCKGI